MFDWHPNRPSTRAENHLHPSARRWFGSVPSGNLMPPVVLSITPATLNLLLGVAVPMPTLPLTIKSPSAAKACAQISNKPMINVKIRFFIFPSSSLNLFTPEILNWDSRNFNGLICQSKILYRYGSAAGKGLDYTFK